MISTAMLAAGVTFSVGMSLAVVVALYIGVVTESALQQRLHSLVRRACHTAVERDACLCERNLRTAADAAADQRIHAHGGEEACQCAVSAAESGHYSGADDLSVLNVIELEQRRMAEVLEYLSVVVSNCYFHVGVLP